MAKKAGEININTKVVVSRNNLGQFARACDEAAKDTVRKIVQEGAREAVALAPKGKGGSYTRKPGYVPLKASIRTRIVGNTGRWYSIAPHAMHVEFGTRRHPIDGFLKFWWAGKGRWFVWNHPDYDNWNEATGVSIMHPGTQAQPFLRPSYENIRNRGMMRVASKEYKDALRRSRSR